MGLHLFSVHHALHGLAAVERVSVGGAALADTLRTQPGVKGAVVLSTCNRVEAYVDTNGTGLAQLERTVADTLRGDGPPLTAAERPLALHRQDDVLRHLFRVASGLDSMVVGEREVAGQLRRALSAATAAGSSTYPLTESIERALRCSRQVAQLPELAAAGRSVVAVGLHLAAVQPGARVLLLGTGSYAGATVAALRGRGVDHIDVYSPTGRAPQFAASHDCTPVTAAGLRPRAAAADVIIACRGAGTYLLTHGFVAGLDRDRPLVILDLALSRDVEPSVADLDGVLLVDLADIQRHVPTLAHEQLREAQRLVDGGVREVQQVLTGRQMDPAVVALADTVQQMVDDEIARLPKTGRLSTDDAAHALRRLAARMIHAPRVRAREAAQSGRAVEFLTGLELIYGIEAELDPDYAAPVDPRTLDDATCPVTGMGLDDLRPDVADASA